jgi:hypothetical protein
MHNPSTADATIQDPTIDRCARMAEKWGYGGIEIVNLYAFRAVRPRDLWEVEDPVGPHNDEHIKRVAAHCKACVVAWGNLPPGRLDRAKTVLKLLSGRPLFTLGLTKMGQPRHPLYLTSDPTEELNIELCPFEVPLQEKMTGSLKARDTGPGR